MLARIRRLLASVPARTDAERRAQHRENVRRYRAEKRERRRANEPDRISAALAWSFEAICEAVGLQPSPQSSLNPERWRDRIDMRRLSLRSKRKP